MQMKDLSRSYFHNSTNTLCRHLAMNEHAITHVSIKSSAALSTDNDCST